MVVSKRIPLLVRGNSQDLVKHDIDQIGLRKSSKDLRGSSADYDSSILMNESYSSISLDSKLPDYLDQMKRKKEFDSKVKNKIRTLLDK